MSASRLVVDGRELALGGTRVSAVFDERRHLFDVVISHPDLPTMPDRGQKSFAFLVLDWTLGEDDVERWIGEVTTGSLPSSSVALADFQCAVDAKAGEQVEATWEHLEGHDEEGQRRTAEVRRPLRWIDQPMFDQHAVILLRYGRERRRDGFPFPGALDQLNALQEDLVSAVGPEAQLLASETGAGFRTLHLYSDSADLTTTQRIEQWVAGTPNAEVTFEQDPGWRAVRKYR